MGSGETISRRRYVVASGNGWFDEVIRTGESGRDDGLFPCLLAGDRGLFDRCLKGERFGLGVREGFAETVRDGFGDDTAEVETAWDPRCGEPETSSVVADAFNPVAADFLL